MLSTIHEHEEVPPSMTTGGEVPAAMQCAGGAPPPPPLQSTGPTNAPMPPFAYGEPFVHPTMAFYNMCLMQYLQQNPPPAAPEPRSIVPAPCEYFLLPSGCRYGSNCIYSHDRAFYMTYYDLHECPNNGCDNLCRGRQCKACHQAMVATRRKDKKADGVPTATEDM